MEQPQNLSLGLPIGNFFSTIFSSELSEKFQRIAANFQQTSANFATFSHKQLGACSEALRDFKNGLTQRYKTIFT